LVVLQRASHGMAAFRIALTEEERRVVNAERDSHRWRMSAERCSWCGCYIVA
jgi:hypothetical protein